MPNWINDSIAISGHLSARDFDVLRELGVSTVITIGEEVPKLAGTPYRHFAFPNVVDGPSDLDDSMISEIVGKIATEARSHKVLVHCAGGVSRSCTFVAAAIANDNHSSLVSGKGSREATQDGSLWEAAKAFVKSGRPQMDVNPWLDVQLGRWVREHVP